MSEKIKSVPFKVHPRFRELLEEIQADRIRIGKEKVSTKIALWRLTKTISNLIDAHPDLYNALVEVDINVQR